MSTASVATPAPGRRTLRVPFAGIGLNHLINRKTCGNPTLYLDVVRAKYTKGAALAAFNMPKGDARDREMVRAVYFDLPPLRGNEGSSWRS